ncbi:MAG: glyoxalase [Actinobacteria bacterium]|nr:glyoxalase [Actinomycetota bacterium]
MSEPVAQVSGLTVQAEREQWQVCGLLPPETDDEPLICGVQFRFVGVAGGDASESGAGLIGWTLEGLRRTGDIDGIPTFSAAKSNQESSDSPLGLVGIDHIVINTDDLQRTSNALLDSTGSELRRVREVSEEMRQGFHKLGGVVIEIVERRGTPLGASLWGVVFNVADLDRACEWLGPDVVSPPKDAVQEGRRIATIRAIAGLRVPIALMSV